MTEVKLVEGEPLSGVELPDGSWWDWDVVAWDASRLRLGAGHDLTYHHELELIFHEPVLVRCPTTFQDPVFRAPTQAEKLSVTRQIGEAPRVIVAFEADAGGQEPTTALIAAEQLEVVRGIVLRYWREDLEPGQRLAPWVQSRSDDSHGRCEAVADMNTASSDTTRGE